MLRQAIIDKIQDLLFHRTGKNCLVREFVPVPGGSINQVYKIATSVGDYFIKLNDAKLFPGMFEAEEKGLDILRRSSFRIPQVISVEYIKEDAFILMEFIEKGFANEGSQERMGITLAAMHKQSDKHFGLDHDNYIGSLSQSNTKKNNWTEFFIEERMEKQLKLAVDTKKMGKEIRKSFDRMYKRLDDIFPAEVPALLHGDLWSGNYLACADGSPCIFDPAVYYGHREVDLAMTKLFGGFSPLFYQIYNEHFPLEKGWEKRVDVFQLYPLLVHVNLFGGSYVADVNEIVKRF